MAKNAAMHNHSQWAALITFEKINIKLKNWHDYGPNQRERLLVSKGQLHKIFQNVFLFIERSSQRYSMSDMNLN